MSSISMIIQWGAVCFGFISAVLWFLSARVGLKSVKKFPRGSDGDVVYTTEEGSLLFENKALPTKLNAWAAIATGIAAILQAIYLCFQ